ncbi:MAG: HAMP domain-containing histidine kinase [Gallionella sp.]|nr:HAMP domain-containing histidine kinase [Gallionella sp.]PIR09057.1 MAG: hypothetical protein COV51_06450 [Gallionellaceae bacterium CG11_big_fil_rev_8_21_14_0_20_60_62]PIV47587.1 MAG: hypothetical protein COS20_04130 [Gallionellaceae bacterium CG02_land_8_20_14_3_00_60_115]PIY05936.1 MAG: hypothetical protein COZ19_02180 [Gallionellaceae bacterium CG_4_10_14_3_um_filter_60_1069]PJC05341.1 MAG: hypothetical protein CO069_00385 [Gallionellaceae bacterium CG_4_9_14_0_8_um_filter_60_335]
MVAEKHHGRAWVQSFPGQGAKFTIILKTAPAANDNIPA